jgi:hypothetical protein
VLQGILHLMHGYGAEDALQLLIHLAHSSVDGEGNVSKSAAVAATFWLVVAKMGSYHSSQLVIVSRSASSMDLHWCSSTNWALTPECAPSRVTSGFVMG